MQTLTNALNWCLNLIVGEKSCLTGGLTPSLITKLELLALDTLEGESCLGGFETKGTSSGSSSDITGTAGRSLDRDVDRHVSDQREGKGILTRIGQDPQGSKVEKRSLY